MRACLEDGWREIYRRADTPGAAGDFAAFWQSVLEAGVWGRQARRESRTFVADPRLVARIAVPPPEFDGAPGEYPFVLHPYSSLALHDGRGANLPWMQELPDPLTSVMYGSWVELNPATAAELGLDEGDVVEVVSAHGSVLAPVYPYPAIRPDVVAMPVGQGHSGYGRYARGRGANPLSILAPLVEPATGGLASAATRVRLVKTGRRVELTKQGGTSRQLGRGIVQTAAAQPVARLGGIPVKVEHT
jgi:anaerobic selenocysteine-containing dehydrogenase